MGNTGSFMLRSGPYKYIAFGHALPQLFPKSAYTAQLFNVEDDPEELHDLASSEPALAANLDRQLQAVVPYEEVDRLAKANDQALYLQYFAARYSEKNLKAK